MKWELLAISSETASKLIQGEFSTFDEFENEARNTMDRPSEIEVLYREVFNSNIEDYVYIIETIFINE